MNDNLKYIHIGSLIQTRIKECAIDVQKISASLNMSIIDLLSIYEKESIPSVLLLKLSKLLHYDFFRIYSQHLILYAPQEKDKSRKRRAKTKTKSNSSFIKNIYTQEVISYLMELTESGRKTYRQLSEEYNIPPTTLTHWADKYGNTFSLSKLPK